MGYPRSSLVVPHTAGTYHCVTRCVRRAFLCGDDPVSGRCFDHRKAWLESRLIELAGIFSISVLAYAVMSNHVHAVLHRNPALCAGWSDEEVATRWVQLFPVRVDGRIEAEACRRKVSVLTGDPARIALLRQRLGDLSWFMRCLSEPLARLANAEDRCTGRFWEGRYRCQALLDDEAVLACMTYVDLNPVRAGIAQDLPESAHTSVRMRLDTPVDDQEQPIAAVAGPGCLASFRSAQGSTSSWSTGRGDCFIRTSTAAFPSTSGNRYREAWTQRATWRRCEALNCATAGPSAAHRRCSTRRARWGNAG